MTEEQTLAEITKVIDRIAPRYTFYGYELDDIKQESFIICADALPRYDATRPLENFLAVHLSNRLKNFVRDNHFIKGEDEKKKIVMPGQLVNEQTILDDREEKDNILDYSEMTSAVDRKLPAEYRSDYLKIINDVYVPKKRKEEVLGLIHEILEEGGHA
jgi:DNA-directed RNA polymerase specialized sigma24 family protein|tara:strand:+ start:998 stop:1474 length:477 start_codon:yes stop_codon:yes gene_type:complete